MVTILLEVKRDSRNEFYNPAPKEFRKKPRTENGVEKAIKDLMKVVKNNEWITDYRFKVYEGNYKHYKDMKPLYIIDKTGNVIA
jgi:hypothetical protein